VLHRLTVSSDWLLVTGQLQQLFSSVCFFYPLQTVRHAGGGGGGATAAVAAVAATVAAAAAEVAAAAAAVAAAAAAAAAAAVVRVADQITANPGLTTYHSAQTNKQFPFNKLPFLQLLHVCWAHSSKENIWGQFRNAFCRRPDALPVVQATVSEH